MDYSTGGYGAASMLGMELIESKSIASDSAAVTFSGLNGEVDHAYFLTYRVKNTLNTATQLRCRPNGTSSNLYVNLINSSPVPTVGASAVTDWMVCSNGTAEANKYTQGEVFILAAKAYRRCFRSMGSVTVAAAATPNTNINIGIWNEETTAITSLEWSWNNGNIASGGEIVLWKVRH